MKKWRMVKILGLAILLLVISGFTNQADAANNGIQYKTHVQNIGWQGYVKEGSTSGTSGQAKRLEAIQIKNETGLSGNIYYKTHIQNLGWEKDFKKNNSISGTSGKALRLEAIQIKLDGVLGNTYDIYYRVHAQNFGWLGWAKNGASAGTEGYAYRLEAIQIKLVKKGGSAPGSTANAFKKKEKPTDVSYQTHVQSIGWQKNVKNGATAGTSGQAKRLEGIKIGISSPYAGNIEYRTHIQSIGWEPTFKKNNVMSGTSGQAKRLEAIQIKLSGNIANYYDVYYRVHAQNFGWMGWTKNGASAGTAGYAYRLEAIQIKLIKKGTTAPVLGNAFKEKPKATQKYNVIVIHKGSDKTLETEKAVSVEKGKQYTAKAKSFNGYTLQGNSSQTITVNGNTTITFNYLKNSGASKEEKKELQALYDKVKNTQKGNYTDDSWNEFQKQLTTTKTVLDSDSVNMSTIITMQSQLQKAYDNLKEKPVQVVKYNVVVIHKGNDGKILQTENAVSVEKGKIFTGLAKTFTGYTLQGNSTQAITVNGNATITFNYKKNEVNVVAIENEINKQALERINAHRKSKGKPALAYNAALQKAATVRSREMAVKFDHIRPNGTYGSTAAAEAGYDKLSSSENLYTGFGTLEGIKASGAEIIVNKWIASSGHNATLLNNYDIEAAVGVYIEYYGEGTLGRFHAVFMGGEPKFSSINARSIEPDESTESKPLVESTQESSEQ